MNSWSAPTLTHNAFRIRTSEISPCKPFRIRTCKSVSKQRTSNPFGMNAYKKPGGRGSLLLTSHPTRMRVPSDQRESRDLSSHAIRTCGEPAESMPVLSRSVAAVESIAVSGTAGEGLSFLVPSPIPGHKSLLAGHLVSFHTLTHSFAPRFWHFPYFQSLAHSLQEATGVGGTRSGSKSRSGSRLNLRRGQACGV